MTELLGSMSGILCFVSFISTAALEEDNGCIRFLFKAALGFYHMKRNIGIDGQTSLDHSRELESYICFTDHYIVEGNVICILAHQVSQWNTTVIAVYSSSYSSLTG